MGFPTQYSFVRRQRGRLRATRLTSSISPHSCHNRAGGRYPQTSDSPRTRVLETPPLTTLTGQHVATVIGDHLDGLMQGPEQPRTSGTRPDMVLAFDPTSENGRVVIFVNGHEPRFPPAATAVFTL